MPASKRKKTTTRARAKPARPVRKTAPTRMAPRADFGKPIDATIARQPPAIRAIAEDLRRMIEQAAPEATSSLKWGQPSFTIAGRTFASVGLHKAHVNLILWGPRTIFPDPKGLLAGAGKMGAHLRITSKDDIPRAAVRGWLKAAVQRARSA